MDNLFPVFYCIGVRPSVAPTRPTTSYRSMARTQLVGNCFLSFRYLFAPFSCVIIYTEKEDIRAHMAKDFTILQYYFLNILHLVPEIAFAYRLEGQALSVFVSCFPLQKTRMLLVRSLACCSWQLEASKQEMEDACSNNTQYPASLFYIWTTQSPCTFASNNFPDSSIYPAAAIVSPSSQRGAMDSADAATRRS